MKKSLIALLLVLALVVTVSVFAVSAEDPNPFKGQTGTVEAPCPYCSPSEDVEWTPLENEDRGVPAGHNYLSGDTKRNSRTTFKADESGNKKVCLNFNGFKLYRSDSTGTGFVEMANDAAVLNLFDTSVEKTGCYELPAPGYSVITISAGTVNHYGGALKRSAARTGNGGGVYMTGGTYNMYGGSIENCGAEQGGGICATGTKTKVIIDGGTIENCYATNRGGSVVLTGSAELQMLDGTIKNGFVAATSATPMGGNIYISQAELTVEGGTIENGGIAPDDATVKANTAHQGGNIALRRGTLSLKDKGVIKGVIKNGGNASEGGNIWFEGGTLEISGGELLGGTANSGGNVYIKNHNSATANAIITDGIIKGGSASNGSNVYLHSAGATFTMSDDAVLDGTGTRGGGKNICVYQGTVNLNGGTIQNAAAGSIQLSNYEDCILNIDGVNLVGSSATSTDPANWARLKMLGLPADAKSRVTITNFSGKMGLDYEADSGDDATAYGLGQKLTNITVANNFEGPAQFFVFNQTDTRKPVAVDGDTLKIVQFAGYTKEGEQYPLETVKGDYAYFMVFYGDNDVILEQDAIVDLNNQSVNFDTNGKKLTPIENRTDGGVVAKNSKFTVDDVNNINWYGVNPVNGYQYVVVEDPTNLGNYTTNRVKVDITKVNVKPSVNGIYYTTNIVFNENVSPKVTNYGVAVSVADKPTANFVNEDGVLYTSMLDEGEALSGDINETTNSAVIANILKAGLEPYGEGSNNERGQRPIFANAYVIVNVNGQNIYIMADEPVALSMKDVMLMVDAHEALPSEKKVQDFYTKWIEPMEEWGLNNIAEKIDA